MYERIMPVFCKNVIPKDQQDPLLFEKMLKEKNTILNMAIQELQKLVANNYKFVEPSRMEDLRLEYETENNTLLDFIKECCYIGNDIPVAARLKRSIFKEAYTKYVEINNNNRGKLIWNDVKLILEKEYNETFIKSNGIYYMQKITLTPEAVKELDIYGTPYSNY